MLVILITVLVFIGIFALVKAFGGGKSSGSVPLPPSGTGTGSTPGTGGRTVPPAGGTGGKPAGSSGKAPGTGGTAAGKIGTMSGYKTSMGRTVTRGPQAVDRSDQEMNLLFREPLPGSEWVCPDCGVLNETHRNYCQLCGTERN